MESNDNKRNKQEETPVGLTSTSGDLRKAVAEARGPIIDLVTERPGVGVNELYHEFASGAATWREPALRTAIWDLIAERRLTVRRGNKLFPAGE